MQINFSEEISVNAQINRAIFTAKRGGGSIKSIELNQNEYLEFCLGMIEANKGSELDAIPPDMVLGEMVYNDIPIINNGVWEDTEV